MIFSFRSVGVVLASAGYAHAALSGDGKGAPILIKTVPASAWTRPALTTPAPHAANKATVSFAGFLPAFPANFFSAADGSSRLLFLSPLSPLRAALRVASQDLAAQARSAVEATAATVTPGPDTSADDDSETGTGTISSTAGRRREILLRQRRRSVLNEREASAGRTRTAETPDSDLGVSGVNGRVEILTLPSGAQPGEADSGSTPGGAGLVKLSGYLTDDLSFTLTGLAAESAATTWRTGAEFELAAGDRNRIEVGAVYGTRFSTANAPFGGEVDRRSVGAFRLVHAMKVLETVTTRAGGRFVDAPFLRSSRSIDPEFSVLVEEPESHDGGRSYLRLALSGDTLFPGLEVVTGDGDGIALSEGLPLLARDFNAQRTWNREAAAGFRRGGTRMEARVQDQTVSHALLVLPSALAGAPYVGNGNRNRVQIGSLMVEKTFARGQAQAAFEYGYGHFAKDTGHADRTRDFHQFTTRFDGYLRRTGSGIAVFHRFHEGASVSNYQGAPRPRMRAQRYLVELRQDVPFVPAMIGADMALLVSLRNVYYDDIERRSVDEFAVAAPPRRITGGIRVKF